MKSKDNFGRYRVLVASCAISLCIGCGYAWSILQVGFIDEAEEIFGKSVPASAVAIAFTICSGISPIPMILVGILQRRFSAQILIAVGGALFCAGYFLTGFTSCLLMLYLTYGVMVGIGSPIAYNIVLNNLIPFFPEKKGFATGIMTALYGGSSIICAQLMQYFINHGGVLYNFRIMGILFACCIGIAVIFIRQAPRIKDETDAVNNSIEEEFLEAGEKVYLEKRKPRDIVIVKDNRFLFLLLIFTACCICGLMIITQSGSMAQAIGAVDDVAGIVSLIGLANVAGRLFWGWLSDKIGRYNTLLLTSCIMTGSGLMLVLTGNHYMFFISFAILTVFSYGGSVGVMPPLLVELFGAKTDAINYGIICIGYAIGGYIGPIIAAKQFANDGTYHTSYILLCIAGITALICVLILKRFRSHENV